MAIFSPKSWDEWVEEYSSSHLHPVNQVCHTIGIPMIMVSILILPMAFFWDSALLYFAVLFSVGWIFQFVGHYYEKKPPEFFKDWRFLFVGMRWWLRKVSRKEKTAQHR